MIDPRRLALALAPVAALAVVAWLAASAGPPASQAGSPPTAVSSSPAGAHGGEPDDAQATPTPSPTPAAAARPRQAEATPTPQPTASAAGPAAASMRAHEPVDPAQRDAAAATAAAWVAAFADAAHPDRRAVLRRHSHPTLAARLDDAALPDAHTGVGVSGVEVTATGRGRVGVRVAFNTGQGERHALEVVVAWHDGQARVAEVRL